ncbi:hypothetical protein ACQUY5_29650 [Bacillus cereus]|uniref:hypothetical protein n=1 Tax=Bacillus cereus group TaxID=86661 RepID=UPI000872EF55|nr:hypothetical protein [Bacillus mycoides]OFD36306.1 hypothetical protein BWGOE1_55920 [Bacillus mycoides]OFD55277.1 hypothetical protein BWGOE6_55020 [Bacillus mycoides]
MNIDKIISDWHTRDIGIKGGENRTNFDEEWLEIFNKLLKNSDEHQDLKVEPHTLLFRVHTGGDEKPQLSDYDDQENYHEVYAEKLKNWIADNNSEAINFNNQWSSFTKSADVIGSNYFEEKGLRGFVIVVSSDKAVYISSRIHNKFDEQEVVAPMDKGTVKEILSFNDFMENYGAGNSDYENLKIKQL